MRSQAVMLGGHIGLCCALLSSLDVVCATPSPPPLALNNPVRLALGDRIMLFLKRSTFSANQRHRSFITFLHPNTFSCDHWSLSEPPILCRWPSARLDQC